MSTEVQKTTIYGLSDVNHLPSPDALMLKYKVSINFDEVWASTQQRTKCGAIECRLSVPSSATPHNCHLAFTNTGNTMGEAYAKAVADMQTMFGKLGVKI